MLYRFQIALSDIDRGVYETLDFRIVRHPSEAVPYLLSRVLAYCLSFRTGLQFSPQGLSDPDAPALTALGDHGSIDLWIEIANPSARKLHKATKAAKEVIVYTYKNPEALVQQIKTAEVHRGDEIKIYNFETRFLEDLEAFLEKNNHWTLLVQQGKLDINVTPHISSSSGPKEITTEINRV